MHFHIAGVGLRRFQHILRQFPQALRLPFQDVDILLLLFGRMVLAQKIHIGNDGCERRLDVMRHIRDEFSLQVFRLQTDSHRILHPVTDGV